MKHLVLIGSAAAKHHFPDFRPSKDYDYIGTEKIINPPVEVFTGVDWILQNCGRIAEPDVLYTIKLSHIFWDINWFKHASDILFFQRKGCVVVDELFDILYEKWVQMHGKKRAYLNAKNEDFFKKTVDRKYVHDTLHQAVAYYDEPLFQKIKPDLSMAQCSKKMFDKLSFYDKLCLCREEIYVTALERFIIPGIIKNENKAYFYSIKQLVTSMSKGWFPRFIMENYSLIIDNRKDFVSDFKRGLEEGVVLKYD